MKIFKKLSEVKSPFLEISNKCFPTSDKFLFESIKPISTKPEVFSLASLDLFCASPITKFLAFRKS